MTPASLKLVAACAIATTVGSAEAGTKVEFQTNMGKIVVEVEDEKAPVTASNFLVYVRKGFYSDVIFHRVIPNFMIQAGGFVTDMKNREIEGFNPAPIINESNNGLANNKYSLSMARTDNPNSATSQFFINLSDNKSLDYRADRPAGNGYAVFAKVVEGKEVVDKIGSVATTRKPPFADVPVEDIVINSAKVIH